MICKLKFEGNIILNEPVLICLQKVKWFQELLFI